MRKAPSLLTLNKRPSAVFLLQSPANHSLSSFPDCLGALIPPEKATGLVSGGFGGLGLPSFRFAGIVGLTVSGGGSFVGNVARLASNEGAVFSSLKEGTNCELDIALGTGGFIMVTGKGPVCGEGGILIGPRGGGEQAAAGSKYRSSLASWSSLGSRYTSEMQKRKC